MKGAAKCDNHCELQNSVNQWIFERILHFWVILGSMPASLLVDTYTPVNVAVCYVFYVVHQLCEIDMHFE